MLMACHCKLRYHDNEFEQGRSNCYRQSRLCELGERFRIYLRDLIAILTTSISLQACVNALVKARPGRYHLHRDEAYGC